MPRIFISYRRAESGGWVTAIYKELVKHFDPADIFRDIDTIDYGVDFVQEIENAVQQCDVLLAMIGPQWDAITDKKGRRWLDDPNDFVRLEIVTALKRGIRVIPVLVGDAAMPYEEQLPADLQPLCRRNALEVGDRDFDHHVERLVRALERVPHVLRVQDILPPPFEWVKIPAGVVSLEDASTKDYDPPGTKGGKYKVPAFMIAKYPVTNAQYDVFVKDGYRDPRWWEYSKEAQKWRKENGQPESTAYEGDDLPRTNVNWYDAVAYCQWLSERVGQKIRLPTEQQWQRAAQGDDGRKYPWGNEVLNEQLCNFGGKVGKPTPVTQYPKGASPFGVMDMSGNVWEWCLTEWGTDAVQLTGDAARVLRGGSWLNLPRARCASRYGNRPHFGDYFRGFRLVCASPL
ncbi:MAG TPA: SUMF1/EgtB/PvdO family nonheme iron enzyme [Aggregatilineaceae bacterium]|nr:SUMF1/EgtB/PvdO family nonheme iron enzyme [Aggregatilineaceae bacterium]